METIDYMEVGARLRELREGANLGLKEIATEFRLSNKSVVHAYETGFRAISSDNVALYAEKFGVTTDWILTGHAPKYRAELTPDSEEDYSELKALFMKLGSKELRTVAVAQLRVLAKYAESEEN